MPCLTRAAVMGGPGVPLVVDAEMATIAMLSELKARPDHWFIAVLKGGTARAAKLSNPQPWQRYRKHDQIRAIDVHLDRKGAPEGGLNLRGVEMVRQGSRDPTTTLFVTNATSQELTIEEIPTATLSRWPHQERRFGDGRNGIGLNRSHGYGGSTVTHVALSTKMEQSDRRIGRAKVRVDQAVAVEARARTLLDAAKRGERTATRAVLNTRARDRRLAQRLLAKAMKEKQRLTPMPREIYVRDTTRDGIVTAAKLTVLMLAPVNQPDPSVWMIGAPLLAGRGSVPPRIAPDTRAPHPASLDERRAPPAP